MLGALSRAVDRLRGSGDAAITVPPLDGAFSPNRRLDEAPIVFNTPSPDNLAADDQHVWFSSANVLFELPLDQLSASPKKIAQFDTSPTCIHVHAEAGIAIGLAGGGLFFRGGRYDGKTIQSLEGRPILCPTALCFEDEHRLVVCLGSQHNDPTRWKRDLMDGNASGSVWQIDLRNDRSTLLADKLAWPGGVTLAGPGRLVVAESWRHRLMEISAGRLHPVLTELPGYPGRIAHAGPSGFWLAVPIPRSQLIEFVLREPRYRRAMMKEINPEYWIAPSLHPIEHHREPLQAGAMRELGEIKPWAPSRSYGLVVRLDSNFAPLRSFHSRADGKRHGITSCVEIGGRLLLTSRGSSALLSLDLVKSGETA